MGSSTSCCRNHDVSNETLTLWEWKDFLCIGQTTRSSCSAYSCRWILFSKQCRSCTLAVELALSSGLNKVAVIDIDVHYGNGTAEGFYGSNRVLTISLHMNHGSWGPSHPQNGTVDELGEGEGRGYNLNIPLPNGSGNRGYAHAMTELVVPAVGRFEPEMMVLVVGQDSSAYDANGRMCLTMEGYRGIGQMIHEMAEKHSQGRILIVQEGGYHLTYSAYCLHATLEGVLMIITMGMIIVMGLKVKRMGMGLTIPIKMFGI